MLRSPTTIEGTVNVDLTKDFLSRVKSGGASVKTQEPPTQSENVPEQKPDTQMEELARASRAASHTGPLVLGPSRSSLKPFWRDDAAWLEENCREEFGPSRGKPGGQEPFVFRVEERPRDPSPESTSGAAGRSDQQRQRTLLADVKPERTSREHRCGEVDPSFTADGTDCQSFGNTAIDGTPEPITADLLPSNIGNDKGVTVSDTLEPVKLPPAEWFDRFIGLGAGTRRVALEDAIACVRLIIVELQGPQAARETEIRLVTPTVPLSALYAECMRLSGHAACWGVVQELQLKARAQQGVRPNQGVPVVALCRPPANGANWSSALAIDAQQVQMLLEQRCWPGV
jgi:hypothetical protein